MAQSPDIIVSIPTDPVATASRLQAGRRRRREAGVHGQRARRASSPARTMSPSVSADNYGNGVASAHLMAKALGGEGEIGLVFHAADFFVTEPALRRLQGDDRVGLPEHQDRRRAGHRRTGLLGRRRQGGLRDADLEPRPRTASGRSGTCRPKASSRRPAPPAATTSSSPRSTSARTSRSPWRRAASSRASARSAPIDQGVTEAMLAGYGLLGKEAPAFVALPALPVDQGQPARRLAGGLHTPTRPTTSRQPR